MRGCVDQKRGGLSKDVDSIYSCDGRVRFQRGKSFRGKKGFFLIKKRESGAKKERKRFDMCNSTLLAFIT